MLDRFSLPRLEDALIPLEVDALAVVGAETAARLDAAAFYPPAVQPGVRDPWPAPAASPGHREPGAPLMFSGWAEVDGPGVEALLAPAKAEPEAQGSDAPEHAARPVRKAATVLEPSRPEATPEPVSEDGARNLEAYRTADIAAGRPSGFPERYGTEFISDPPGPVDTPPEAFERALDDAVPLTEAEDLASPPPAPPPPDSASPAPGEIAAMAGGDGALPPPDLWL